MYEAASAAAIRRLLLVGQGCGISHERGHLGASAALARRLVCGGDRVLELPADLEVGDLAPPPRSLDDVLGFEVEVDEPEMGLMLLRRDAVGLALVRSAEPGRQRHDRHLYRCHRRG